MKNKLWLSILIILLTIFISACTSNGTSTSDGDITSTETVITETQTSELDVDVNETSQLILGTILMDGSSEEITQEQAQSLLPLWQLYQSMLSEDATASEELTAIINQIKSIHTEEQLTAMTELDYSNPMAALSELDLEQLESFSNEDGEGVPRMMSEDTDTENRGDGGGGFERGNAPEGGSGGSEGRPGGGDGMEFNAGENVDPDAMATAQAERGGINSSQFQNQRFLTILIKYLEMKSTP